MRGTLQTLWLILAVLVAAGAAVAWYYSKGAPVSPGGTSPGWDWLLCFWP